MSGFMSEGGIHLLFTAKGMLLVEVQLGVQLVALLCQQLTALQGGPLALPRALCRVPLGPLLPAALLDCLLHVPHPPTCILQLLQANTQTGIIYHTMKHLPFEDMSVSV